MIDMNMAATNTALTATFGLTRRLRLLAGAGGPDWTGLVRGSTTLFL
jgi:hypothetical protein